MKCPNHIQMREIDRKAIEEYGIPSICLMENAGRSICAFLQQMFTPLHTKKIAIVAGPGNNGGDGFCLARHLFNQGIPVTVYLLTTEEQIRGDARINFNILSIMNIPIRDVNSSELLRSTQAEIFSADIIVDAILGTGISTAVKGIYLEAINLLNESRRPIVSIDIPSGLDVDRGIPLGACIHATATCTLALPKIGLVIYPGVTYVGALSIGNIGIPPTLLNNSEIKVNLLTHPEMMTAIPHLSFDAHKGSCGRVVILGGSVGMTGAAALASEAAILCGAGLVTLGIPKSLNEIMEVKLTEVMTKPLPETAQQTLGLSAYNEIEELLRGASILAIGPGLSRNEETLKLVRKVISLCNLPMVIDADALFAVANTSILKDKKTPVVITPHPGEMATLLGDKSAQDVQSDRLSIAGEFAQKYGVVVVLKGARSIIACPTGEIYINPTGNPGMASGGMGDVLTGMISAFIGLGMNITDAAKLATYLHGLSGDISVEKEHLLSITATKLLSNIPNALNINLLSESPTMVMDQLSGEYGVR